MLPQPLHTRRQIPFYHHKTEAEFRHDIYERYDDMVVRQVAIHLADRLWKYYPFQPILDLVLEHIDTKESLTFADIGCSVGRLVGELAQQYPQAKFYGIDYSYQLLRQAQDYWCAGKMLELDWTSRGFEKQYLSRKPLKNLHFALAKAEKLPFKNNSLDSVCSSFLFDRLEQPLVALQEMYRVLKPGGQLFLITPSNFQKATHWEQFYPFGKLIKQLEQIGFAVEMMQENMLLKEPLDIQKNEIIWKCVAVVARRIEL